MTSSVPQQPISLNPIAIPSSARSYFTEKAYGPDAATFTQGDGLWNRFTAWQKYGSQSDLQEMLGQAVNIYRQQPGKIQYDAATNQFTGFTRDQFKGHVPGGWLSDLTGNDFFKSPEFQEAFYKRLQQTDLQERLDKPVLNSEGVPGLTLREELDLLNQGDMNTAQLSGRGATVVIDPTTGKPKVVNSVGGMDKNGKPVVGTLIGGGPGSGGRIDVRQNPLLIKKAVELQKANQILVRELKALEGSGDLDNVEGGKELLARASITRNPKLNDQLAVKKGAALNNRTNRVTGEAAVSADEYKYGGGGRQPTKGGQMEIDKFNQTMEESQNRNAINLYNAANTAYQTKMDQYRWNTERKDNLTAAREALELERHKIAEGNKQRQWEYAENERQRQWKEAENEKQRLYEARNRGWGSIGNIFQMFYGSSF